MNINASDADSDQNAARLERQIARANQAFAHVQCGYYVTDEELDTHPDASKVERTPVVRDWV
ncbi:hypothetical protein [Paraburkholderia oxyphila]|uniref:hypothetical protein n=1 Tax=Paraburkholderia oxyphila TaxID=614212 RepID=UPI000A9D5097|nr:hypothetical protein [Paraburkholderia oxyphila]